MNRNGMTLIEVMMAVAFSSFIAAIGFTGITAFGRSVTRAKQFASETELITTAMRLGVKDADMGSTFISSASGILPNLPPGWTSCAINRAGQASVLTFTLTIAATAQGTAATTGDVRNALGMIKTANSGTNTVRIQTLACLP